jgi:hypothetical protein
MNSALIKKQEGMIIKAFYQVKPATKETIPICYVKRDYTHSFLASLKYRG